MYYCTSYTGFRQNEKQLRIEYNKELVEKAGYTEFPDTGRCSVTGWTRSQQEKEPLYGVGFYLQSVPF